MKNSRGKSAGRCFLKPIFFFRIRENFFQSFRTKFLSLVYILSLAYKISHCLSANHNPELRCVICTAVTVFLHWRYSFFICTGVTGFFCTGVTVFFFALALHYFVLAFWHYTFLHWCYTFCTALLSANQNRVIFSCVLLQ